MPTRGRKERGGGGHAHSSCMAIKDGKSRIAEINFRVSQLTENNIIYEEVLHKEASILSVFTLQRPPMFLSEVITCMFRVFSFHELI